MADRQRNLGGGRTTGTRTRNLGSRTQTGPRTRNLGQGASTGPHPSVHGIGGFFHNFEHGITSAAVGALPALETAGVAAYKNVRHPLRGQNLSLNPLSGRTASSPFEKAVVNPLVANYKHQYGPVFSHPLSPGAYGKVAHNIYDQPFNSFLDALTVATLGAGGVARGGEALAGLGAIKADSRLALLRSTEGKGIVLRGAAAKYGGDASKVIEKDVHQNPLIRARQRAVDRMLKRVPTTGAFHQLAKLTGEDARYGRAVRREAYHNSRRIRALGYPFEKAWYRLNKNERIAFSYHSDALHPTEEAAYLKSQHPNWETDPSAEHDLVRAAIKRGEDPGVIDAYEHPSVKLQHAIDEGRALSKRLERERISTAGTGLDEEGMAGLETSFAERPYLHLRLARGADFKLLPAEGGRLARARSGVVRLQKDFDRVQVRVRKEQGRLIDREAKRYLPSTRTPPERFRPRTVEEARTQLADLDKQYESFIDAFVSKKLTKDEVAENRSINTARGKYKRQQTGRTKAGKASGASGYRLQSLPKTVNEQKRAEMEAEINKIVAANPDAAGSKAFLRTQELRDELRAKINTHEEQTFLGGEGAPPIDFGAIKLPPKERVPVKPRKGEPSTAADFAAIPFGNKVLTHDQRLLTPRGGALLEGRGARLSAARTELERAEEAAMRRHGHVPEPGQREKMVLRGGPSIEDLQAEGRDPFYVPDIVRSKASGAAVGGIGKGVVSPERALKQNLGEVFRNGALYRDPRALHVGHLRQVRHELATSIHKTLLENGVRVGEHEHIPKDWVYIRQDASESISHLVAKRGEALDELKDMHEPVDFLTSHGSQALLEDGFHIAVPKAFADKLTGEFTRSDSAIKALWEKPTKVWRAMVLGLRVGFFTNNVVGNYLLYALRHNGWDSVQSWLAFLRETHQEKALDELGRDVTFRKLAMEHIPEAFTGTFVRSQLEDLPGIGKLGRFRQGVGPLTVKVAEEHPRLQIAREVVIKEAKSLGQEIPKQAKEFNEMADEMFRRPGVAKRAVDEANRTLGDYLQFSKTEEAIRGIVPFYSWIRAITKIALQTVADTPGRALLISQLGEIAVRENESKYGPLPSYLQGFIGTSGVKNGQVSGITTKGLDPFASIADVERGLHGLLVGQPGEGASALAEIGPHPFLQAMYEWASGKSMMTGGKVHPALLPGLPGYTLGSIAENFPQVQLAKTLITGKGRKSKTYANNNSRVGAALGFAGVPYKKVNLPAANLSARLPNRR